MYTCANYCQLESLNVNGRIFAVYWCIMKLSGELAPETRQTMLEIAVNAANCWPSSPRQPST